MPRQTASKRTSTIKYLGERGGIRSTDERSNEKRQAKSTAYMDRKVGRAICPSSYSSCRKRDSPEPWVSPNLRVQTGSDGPSLRDDAASIGGRGEPVSAAHRSGIPDPSEERRKGLGKERKAQAELHKTVLGTRLEHAASDCVCAPGHGDAGSGLDEDVSTDVELVVGNKMERAGSDVPSSRSALL